MRGTAAGLTVVAALVSGPAGALADETPGARHLIYLHGRIIQEHQDPRPRHPEWGHYKLEGILDAFRELGFEVTGEIRPRSASVSEAADRVVGQVERLLDAGVSADRITVVGASMGAAIALVASARLQNPEVRFSFLGACLAESVARIRANEGKGPSGRLLFIREASDEMSASCAPPKGGLELAGGLLARELLLDTGLSHGFLYRPLPEWVQPVVEWATEPPALPAFLTLDQPLEAARPRLEKVCERVEEKHYTGEAAAPFREQTQIDCYDALVLGARRKVELMFNEEVLEFLWILAGSDELEGLRGELAGLFGGVVYRSAPYEVFASGTVALRSDPPEVLIATPELMRELTGYPGGQ